MTTDEDLSDAVDEHGNPISRKELQDAVLFARENYLRMLHGQKSMKSVVTAGEYQAAYAPTMPNLIIIRRNHR